MAQPVVLRLSPAEWMLSVMTVQPDAAPVLADAVNRTMTPERLQGALQAAHDVLLARDLARLNNDGKLDINPLLRMCTRAVLSPRVSFGLTLIEADGSSRVVFYNWLPGLAIGTWVDANQIRSFELLDGDDLIAVQMLALWDGNTSKPTEAGEARTINLPAASLPALPVDHPGRADGLTNTLVRGGLQAEDAAGLERAFAATNRRAVLAAAGPAAPTRTLMWLGSTDRVWLVAQTTGANNVAITSANSSGFAQTLTAFVRELLSSAGKG